MLPHRFPPGQNDRSRLFDLERMAIAVGTAMDEALLDLLQIEGFVLLCPRTPARDFEDCVRGRKETLPFVLELEP